MALSGYLLLRQAYNIMGYRSERDKPFYRMHIFPKLDATSKQFGVHQLDTPLQRGYFPVLHVSSSNTAQPSDRLDQML